VLARVLPLAPRLDAVWLVEVPPADTWSRKPRFSYVELGGQGGYSDLGRESFIA
jgi:hypothetical protein